MLVLQHSKRIKDSNEFQKFIPYDARKGKTAKILEDDVKNIKKLYNNFNDVRNDNLQSFFEVKDYHFFTQKMQLAFYLNYQYISDSRFIHGTHRNLLSRLNHRGASVGKTYAYRFSYDFPNRNHHKITFVPLVFKEHLMLMIFLIFSLLDGLQCLQKEQKNGMQFKECLFFLLDLLPMEVRN